MFSARQFGLIKFSLAFPRDNSLSWPFVKSEPNGEDPDLHFHRFPKEP